MGLEINVGEFDPALGRSYNEIAAEGRSMHRSQAWAVHKSAGPAQPASNWSRNSRRF
jgi:hypothetical protein